MYNRSLGFTSYHFSDLKSFTMSLIIPLLLYSSWIGDTFLAWNLAILQFSQIVQHPTTKTVAQQSPYPLTLYWSRTFVTNCHHHPLESMAITLLITWWSNSLSHRVHAIMHSMKRYNSSSIPIPHVKEFAWCLFYHCHWYYSLNAQQNERMNFVWDIDSPYIKHELLNMAWHLLPHDLVSCFSLSIDPLHLVHRKVGLLCQILIRK